MPDHSVMTLGEETVTVKVSWDTNLFDSVESYIGDGFEMSDNLVVTLGQTLHSHC